MRIIDDSLGAGGSLAGHIAVWMGVCHSCNTVEPDIPTHEDSESDDDDYVERITHITADIHEMIRRKVWK